ncbi:MAG: preprotein translocase subunit SecE [Actinomycetaceae bacterium]|nr:preprotein translocase subunit SecE [Actinomycetaceae bacterium]
MSDSAKSAGEAVHKDRTKSDATRSRAQAAHHEEEKLGFFARIIRFVSEVISEMKKVHYPTPKETWTYFLVVTFFVVVIMAYTGLLDFLFARLAAIVFG